MQYFTILPVLHDLNLQKKNVIMRVMYFILIVGYILLSSKLSAQSLLIKNVSIISILERKIISNKSIYVKDGIIIKIADAKQIGNYEFDEVIEAKGMYLMHGLADMHVHLHEDSMLSEQLATLVNSGITHVRIMKSDTDQITTRISYINNEFHRTPILKFSKVIYRSESYSATQADSLVEHLKRNGIDFIKIFGLSNEETFYNIMNAANKGKIIVCGHYPMFRKDGKVYMIPFDSIAKYKFKGIEHLGGYTSMDSVRLTQAIALTKEQQIFNCPTLDYYLVSNHTFLPNKIESRISYRLSDDTLKKSWNKDFNSLVMNSGGMDSILKRKDKFIKLYQSKYQPLIKELYTKECLLLVGSDAENIYQVEGKGIFDEMKDWNDVGIDNYGILRAATYNASLFFEEQDMWGSVAEGKEANLILLKRNPVKNIENIASITHTIIKGKVYVVNTK